MGWGAVVLAGGRARRLGGVDKPALVVGGRTMLDTVLLACAGAGSIVVVGETRPVAVEVGWVREEPPHGGPLAGLTAGLGALPGPPELVAVLAADLPGLRAGTVGRLLDAVDGDGGTDGALLVDRDGRPQWLAGVWRCTALRRGLAELGNPSGRPLHALLGGLRAIRVPGRDTEVADIDTAADLAAHSRHTGDPVT
ncbi:MAG TPA: molybdenum cofactor guanylyltransferase [Pseudonocardiaceae bacterium]|nr:molybdenum cofactor guanylyltransferase [Pseudonocardiaceae bacterium]